ncbi:MAG TPA: hypothetical protein VF516_19865 [Kofleriaceae bacterium]
MHTLDAHSHDTMTLFFRMFLWIPQQASLESGSQASALGAFYGVM